MDPMSGCMMGMQGMGGMMMAGMMLLWVLTIALLVLGIAALWKYLRSDRNRPPQT